MEVSGLNGFQSDEEMALSCLLDAFGSVFSLNDIASAYCEAGRDANLAGQILYEIQGSSCSVVTDQSNGEAEYDETLGSTCGNNSQNYCQANGDFTDPKQNKQPVSAANDASTGNGKEDEPSESNSLQNSCQTNGDLRAPKKKGRSVSGGTVSSMLGKEYMKSVPLANGSHPGTKPLKVDSKELARSSFWGEGQKSNSLKEDRMHKDMEDFLFKMLGDGFRLDRDVIRDVLGKPTTNDIHPRAGEPSEEKDTVSNANVGATQQKNRNDLEMEVLAALFDGPQRFDELPRIRMRSKKRPIALGTLVEGPLIDDFAAEQKADRVCLQEDKKDDEDIDEDKEDSFQALRKAVKEYRGTMKEYYKAAVDAFAKGDQDQANRLLEQVDFGVAGTIFREKAREADEESNKKIFETRNTETEDEMLLDLHDHGAKEAIKLLKCHLSSLASIPSLKYLKVIVDTDDEDSSKGTRRRLVMKLLEKESISWSERENSGVVLIRLDKINPKSLSFAKK